MSKFLLFLFLTVSFSSQVFSETPEPLKVAAASPSPSPLPYWKAKKEVYRKIRDERFVAVSAHAESVKDGKTLTVSAAGLIHAPESFTHQEVMDFNKYAKFLPYILESALDPKTQNLFIHGALLGYHVEMTLHLTPEKTAKGDILHWESIQGGFVGMKGNITEDADDIEHTEISLAAAYTGETLKIPEFILSWGLEFAAQRAATAMRTHIESDYSLSKKH